jgi:REP element-mobilizing transposase RayT
MGAYKSAVTRRINELRQSKGAAVWQRGYYERVIRDERELNSLLRYIRDNPSRWEEDRYYVGT